MLPESFIAKDFEYVLKISNYNLAISAPTQSYF